jgi:hypothetical protein
MSIRFTQTKSLSVSSSKSLTKALVIDAWPKEKKLKDNENFAKLQLRY